MPERTGATPHRLASSNLPWIGALVLFVLVALKVAIVSRFQPETIAAIASGTTISSVVLGVVASALGPLLLFSYFFLLTIYEGLEPSAPDRPIYVGLIILTGVLAALANPWFWILLIAFNADAYLGGRIGLSLYRRWKTRRTRAPIEVGQEEMEELKRVREAMNEATRALEAAESAGNRVSGEGGLERLKESLSQSEASVAIVEARVEELQKKIDGARVDFEVKQRRIRAAFWLNVAFLGGLALLTLVDSRLWLPAEHFTLLGGQSIVGYAIGDERPQGLLVMIDRGRTVRRLTSGEIIRRDPCVTRSSHTNPLLNSPLELMFGAASTYPECYPKERQPPTPTGAPSSSP